VALTSRFTRRKALALAALAPRALAQTASQLPLKTTGLEHVGFTVHDPEKSSRFYGRIFDPQTFQERDPPPRYYVRLGTGYAAFGAGATTPARIDHICALVEDYRIEDLRKELDVAGVKLTGQAAFGLVTDPDGHRLQLIGTPAGLAKTIIPATRVTQDDAAVQAIGLDHIMLTVSDLEKSAAYHRRFFGPEVSRTKNPARVWFAAARTRLGLEAAGVGKPPRVDHFSVRVAGFDRGAVAGKLQKLGVEIVPSTDEKLLRFRDSDGIIVELKGT
jgi:catechol 2,3-dioxygenase-like lactoylglutathione lyase family enzyme